MNQGGTGGPGGPAGGPGGGKPLGLSGDGTRRTPNGGSVQRYTDSQMKALAYASKATAFLSILGSSWIIYELLFHKDRNSKGRGLLRRSTYHQIILCMSLVDLLSSLWIFVGTWALNLDTAGPRLEDVGASGTQATCSAQGFFIQLGIASPMYNVSLALYALLVVRYGWKESKIKKRAAKVMLYVPALFGLATAVSGLPLELYNFSPVGFNCFISPHPYLCDPWDKDQFHPECVRGENANKFRLAFSFLPAWLSFLAMLVCMIMVYLKVWVLEKNTQKWNWEEQERKNSSKKNISSESPDDMDRSNPRSLKASLKESLKGSFRQLSFRRGDSTRGRKSSRSRKVAVQAFFFIGAFLVSWTFFLVYSSMMIDPIGAARLKNFGLNFVANFLFPAQGFFNFIVFIRPRYVNFQERHPDWSIRKTIFRSLKKTFKRDPVASEATPTTAESGNKDNNEEDADDLALLSEEEQGNDMISNDMFSQMFEAESSRTTTMTKPKNEQPVGVSPLAELPALSSDAPSSTPSPPTFARKDAEEQTVSSDGATSRSLGVGDVQVSFGTARMEEGGSSTDEPPPVASSMDEGEEGSMTDVSDEEYCIIFAE